MKKDLNIPTASPNRNIFEMRIVVAIFIFSLKIVNGDVERNQDANAKRAQHDVVKGRQHWQGESVCRPTSADVLGPYYLPYPPARQQLCDRDPDFPQLTGLLVVGRLRAEDCTPLEGAKLELWQADHRGHYIIREHCRGFIRSGKGGYYSFLTIHPGKYKVREGYRPAHIHFRVELEGYDTLVTQMYFEGDPNLGRNDSCTACSSDKSDLVVETYRMCPDDTGDFCFDMGHFDITLRRGHGADVIPDVDDEEAELMDMVHEGK